MFKTKRLIDTITIATFIVLLSAIAGVAQDDDTVKAKVLDTSNRPVGRADLVPYSGEVSIMFDYKIKVWLDGGSRLIYIRPESGSRSSGIKASFREYKVNPKNPTDSSGWNETGSGTATLQMSPSGEVQRITASVTLTTKVVGDNETAVSEKPQKFTIVLD